MFIENQKIKSITLKSRYVEKNKAHWMVVCACGKVKSLREDYIQRRLKTDSSISCGCQKETKLVGNQSPRWKGCGQLSAAYFCLFQKRAKEKDIQFSISMDFLWNLIQKQDFKCALSGLPIILAQSKRTGEIMTASIDRKDSLKGYTEDNVQWVHKTINMMKNVLDESEFISFCKAVSSNNPS